MQITEYFKQAKYAAQRGLDPLEFVPRQEPTAGLQWVFFQCNNNQYDESCHNVNLFVYLFEVTLWLHILNIYKHWVYNFNIAGKVSRGLPVLAHLIFHEDDEVLSDACWALSYLSDGPNNKIQSVIEANVCRRLVELLGKGCNNVISAALRAVGNIVTGDDTQTQVVLNCGALPSICFLLSAEKETIIKEACWTVSNIAAGNTEQIQAIIDNNIFPLLINILTKSEFKTRKEAAWAITNATSGGTVEQIKYLVSLIEI